MPSSYSPNLRIELIASGEQANTWGYTTNTNLGTLIEQAICGQVALNLTTTAVTLTALNGASDQSRQMILNCSGTPGGTTTITAPAVSKIYIVANNTTDASDIQIKTSGGNAVVIANGTTKTVWCDGADFHEATNAFQQILLGANPTTDYMAATKTYVDTAITGYFPSGTTLLFYQASAPTGWTQVTTSDDAALRVVSGAGGTTGGSVGFTTAFASQAVSGSVSIGTATGTVGDTAITTAQLPAHNHGVNDPTHTHGKTDPGHAHGLPGNLVSGVGAPGTGSVGQIGPTGGPTYAAVTGITISAAATGISIQNTGSDQTHTHSLTMDAQTGTFTGTAINLAVKYINVILASKN